MPSFGSFETEREVYSGPNYTVYSARKSGDPNTEYAVKVFDVLPTALDVETAGDLTPLVGDPEQSCVERIAVQQRAAAASEFISAILETGQDERGVWYATRFYPRSVNKIIIGRVQLNRDALEHIMCAMAQGALDIKRTCGRSHGDIQPSNVHISVSERLAEAKVVLSDPLPGDEREAERYELSDLHSIGRILLQFVLQRAIDEDEVLIPPFALSPEWTRLFRKDAERWLSLCNRLLDSNLSLEQLNLERLVEQLEQLRAKPAVSRKMVLAAAAVALMLAAVAVFTMSNRNRDHLLITSDPPGAEIKVELKDTGKYESLGNTPLDGKPLKVTLRKGSQTLRAEYAGLAERTHSVEVGTTREQRFVFSYGRVQITSAPDGVVDLDGNKLGPTPYTSTVLKPGKMTFYVRATGHDPAKLTVVVPADRTLYATNATLVMVSPDDGIIEFDSQPRGAKISKNGVYYEETTPFPTKLVAGTYKITAELEGWPPITEEVVVRPGENPPKPFYFRHGAAEFKIEPEGAKVFVNDKPIESTRKTLPPGTHSVRVEQSGYESHAGTITITESNVTPVSVALTALQGIVEFISNVPEAIIFNTKTPERKYGPTQLGQPLKISLPPGTYSFRAHREGLDPIPEQTVQIELRKSKSVPFSFKQATVEFITEPPGAEVRIVDGNKVVGKSRYVHYHKPGPITYKLEMPDYDAVLGTVNLTDGQTIVVSNRLERAKVDIALRSDPPGAQFFVGDKLLGETNGHYLLPWGTNTIIARHPNLDPLTNAVHVDRHGKSSTNVVFSYATLQITNEEPEARLLFHDKVNNKHGLVADKLPVQLHLKPEVQYDFVIDCGGDDRVSLPVKMTAYQVFKPIVTLPEVRRTFVNSIGMTLVRVAGMGKEMWVGKHEVTEGEYAKVMGGVANWRYSEMHPQVMITAQQAADFCAKLSQIDKNAGKLPPGMDSYTLPTEEQWEYFVADAQLDDAVTSRGRTPPRDKPDAVGTLRANRYGLHDVRGNVYEMCSTTNGFVVKGGAFDGVREAGTFGGAGSLALKYRATLPDLPSPLFGFRVICVPRVPGATAQK